MNLFYSSICIIGTGGTGGNLVPPLARLLSHLPYQVPKLILIDDDIVESHNCQRQNFIYSDVGRFKSQVLSERYSGAFGIPIYYYNERLTSKNFWDIIPQENTLIIDSVDNLKTRVLIHNQLKPRNKKTNTIDWISLGNTDDYGQLVFRSVTYFGIKTRDVVDVYPDDYSAKAIQAETEQDEATRANCALNAVSKPQSLAINLFGANIAINVLYQLYYDEKSLLYDIVIYDRFNNVRLIPYGKEPYVLSEEQRQNIDNMLQSLQAT